MPAQPADTGAVDDVVRSALAEAGFELDSLDVATVGSRQRVRVVVDTADDPAAQGDGPGSGPDLDAIAVASRAVATALDADEDLIHGAYTLEVTSPGVDRPLTLPRHWRRNRLRLVRVVPVEGSEIIGRVGDADDTSVRLLVEGAMRTVRYDSVRHAVVEIEFRPAPSSEIDALTSGQVQDQNRIEETR